MEKIKNCNICLINKKLDNFCIVRKNKDGLNTICKSCNNLNNLKYFKTKSGLLSRIYGKQKESSIKRCHVPPKYTSIEFRNKYIDDLLFIKLYNTWVTTGYKKRYTPSGDRKNDYASYSFENITFVPWWLNKNKGHRGTRIGKLKTSIPHKPVLQIHKYTGNIINEFISIHEAERATGALNQNISKCCNGKHGYKTAKGYIWKFKL